VKYEDRRLNWLHERGLNKGEVTEVSGAGLTVAVDVSPGDQAIKYAPGTEVFVLTADDVLALVPRGAL
tara:strand:+ start:1344 stop:1547 length:204 start_codon:yes stop_codon:yes gene_type:complete